MSTNKSMNIDLKPYQEKAVNQLIDTTVKLLGYDGPGEVCVFQAPTGSGKTIVMAKYIEGLIKELPKDDLCFIWMSIGKGELHLQSKHSLEKIFAGFPRVTLVEDAFSGGRERIVQIEFLIFKQAIDTGWDCPRAHILVKFRETHNIVFEIQTVGRILRMPEQRHYGNEALNRGYIYTNLKSIEVKKEEYNPNIIKHLRAGRISGYKPVKIESYYKARADYGDVTSSFHAVFEKAADQYFGTSRKNKPTENAKKVEAKGVDLTIKKYQQEIIADTHLDVKSFDELEGKLGADGLAKLQMAADELMVLFEQTIKNNLGPFKNVKRSVPTVKSAIYIWFREVLDSESWGDDDLFMAQKIFLHDKNRGYFEHILSTAIDRYGAVKEQEVKERIEESEQQYPFELQPEQFYNEYTDEIVKIKKYAYEPCYLNMDRSKPEREFETFLNSNAPKIDWWWKNGENKQDYFGIKYEYAGSIYTFYPDYLVRLTDGRLGIFEVKDAADRDGKTYTGAKAEALQKYIIGQKNKKLFGGIVIERNKAWHINSKKAYDWERCERDNWDDWDGFWF